MAVEQVQGQGQGQGQGQLRGQAAPPASLLRHTDHTCAAPATPVQHPLPVLGPGPSGWDRGQPSAYVFPWLLRR